MPEPKVASSPAAIACRADLIESMAQLQAAHAALVANDLRAAIIKIEVAQGALAEVRRQLPSFAAAGYATSTPVES